MDLLMARSVVYLLYPGLRGTIQKLQGKRFNPGEHGQQAPFEPRPKCLLFAILIVMGSAP